ncbi:hypothetical protein HMN09_01259900 [Mycena chlorophos]|uniref:Uncharacterized protein n=1 Tax=Mycena chlorophos TaxID=658473 RepID=A0A8H6S439_MYCCL|nr:hypothetical protein HMN09_01259900 [Mycena chlorophos]
MPAFSLSSMMYWLSLLLAASLVAAQSSASGGAASGGSASGGGSATGGASGSAQVTVITSFSTSVGLASGRVPTTSVFSFLITETLTPTAATSAASGGSSSATSSTSQSPLPTGTASVATELAPSPGATGGQFGPDDGYIAAGSQLRQNALMGGAVVAAVGGYLAL